MAQLRGTIPKRNHTGFDAHRLELSAVELVRTPRQLLVVDIRSDRHLPGVNLEDPGTGSLVWQRELDLSVQTSGPEQSGIKNVDTGRGRNNL